MELRKRRWILLGLAITAGLLVLGRSVLLPEDLENAGTPKKPLASAAAQRAPQSQALSELEPLADRPAIKGGTFRARAIDALTREPVEQFEVQLRRAEENPQQPAAPITRRFQSDDGRVAWNDVPVGDWTVSITARGYQRFELGKLSIVSGAKTAEFLTPLLRGHTVKGRVFDENSRAGIGSARILFREAHVDLMSKETFARDAVLSRKDGSFVLQGVPAGGVTLTASAKEYAVREVDIVVDENTPSVDVGLSAGGSVSGFLTAMDGAPVAGTATLASLDQRSAFVRETSETGEFSFKQLPEGRYRITGRADQGTVSREIVLADDERLEGIVLALGKGRSVRGVVRGLRPERFKDVAIFLRAEGKRESFSSQLDDQGAYVMHGVPPGRARLEAHLSMNQELSRIVEVPADADLTSDIVFALGVRLSGRVTRAGESVSGTTVWAWPVEDQGSRYEAQTSPKGTYEIENLVEGDYTVSVEAGAGVVRRARLSGDTVFDIEVPSTQLAGRVLEDGSTVPIVGAGIHVVGAKAEPLIRVYQESDHFGQFEVTGFDPADLLVSVYKPGYEMFRERIAYGSPETDLAFRLRRSNGVEVRIQEADGSKILRDVFLSETIGDSKGIGLWIRLDENGVGSIPSALAGSRLSFGIPGHEPAVVDKWDARPLDLRLTRH
jgi:hypothetical protein